MTTTPTLDRSAQIANSIDVGPSGNDQFEAQLVGLDDGRFVVLWTDNSDAAPGEDDGTDILAQVFDVFGNAVGSAQQVNQNWFLDEEGEFSVAALPGGKFVIAFEDQDVDGVSIRAEEAIVAADHSIATVGHTILSDPGADDLGDPAVSARADGSYSVIYSRSTIGASTDAFAKIVSPDGTVGAEFSVLTGSDDVRGEGFDLGNDAATLTNGNYVTVHAFRASPDGDRGVGMRIFNSSGGGVLGATEVATTIGDADTDTQPAVAALAGGGYVVVWTNEDANDADILFRIFDAAGTEVAAGDVDNLGSAENYNEPAVIGLKDGGFVVVYDDDALGVDAIKGRRFDANGVAIGDTFIIANSGLIESEPALDLMVDGRVLVSWRENDAGDNDIRTAIYDPRETTINGDGGANVIAARLNEDTTLNGLAGDDTLFGRNGDDTLNGGDGDDSLLGGDGDDVLATGAGEDAADGGAGIDTLDLSLTSVGATIDLAAGTADFPTFFIESILNFENVVGTTGDDTISGTAGANAISSLGGDDTLMGLGGNDSLFAGFGDDRAEGGSGNDFIRSGPGKDTLLGGEGNDTLGASNRADLLRGEGGDDFMLGSNGNDRLFGGDDNDTLLGGNGRDTLSGDAGADRLVGGNQIDWASYDAAGAAVSASLASGTGSAGEAAGDVLVDIENLEGSAFNDTLTGSTGANRLDGGAGNDAISGLGGADILAGEGGADSLTGGAGDDKFWYSSGADADRITDFTPGAATDDVIRLFGFGAAVNSFAEVIALASQVGADTVIDFGGGNSITLAGVAVGSLHADDFLFG